MKILVLSDTHGELGKVYEVYRNLENIDMIVHLGDCVKDAMDLEEKLAIPIVSVPGNMDGMMPVKDLNKIIKTEVGDILLTHGHYEGVHFDVNNLIYKAEEKNCIAAFFGHTHIACLEDFNGFTLLNPGSLTRPRDGSTGSYAIVSDDKGILECRICYYRKNEKPRGGYLKSLMNYSDRF